MNGIASLSLLVTDLYMAVAVKFTDDN